MGKRLALVTGTGYPHADVDQEGLTGALTRRGVDVAVSAWSDATVDWASFDAAVIRSTWDYHANVRAFLTWANATAEKTKLLNPAAVVGWNADKRSAQLFRTYR